MEEIELIRVFRFDAAHLLPKVPDGHKCKRLHGHTFKFKVHLKGSIDPDSGWLMDFGDIKEVVKPLIDNYLDHYYLNEIEGLENPTSENLAVWIWNKLKPSLPLLYRITVYETCNSACIYMGKREIK
ncbi:MAG: 6-carboxytetrahydropterin synthase QueD [Leptospiraceae bacterium]|nr:6-carboxytetrahydropterin synthase QueD [Leptospiraceae bacterium]MCP5499316.1 6-carboxytetrahydropterin synthase QueD [Leptospiraceae bacterium]